MTLYTFSSAIANTALALKNRAYPIHTESWQGVEISDKPEMKMMEIRHLHLTCEMPTEDLNYYRDQIKPNLPWADDHFEQERVSGEPLNPGQTWRQWPYAHSADKFRTIKIFRQPQFNHTYAERYWPKFAAMWPDGKTDSDFFQPEALPLEPNHGIRYPYGDLRDVVNQLNREPHTRQAILPVFFPEDTGATHGDRVPCSLFYQFFVRPDPRGREHMDISYFIRSCDWTRHFRDDLYLTVRLLLWVLDELRKLDKKWNNVTPGIFVMTITSLHVFINDYNREFK